MADDPVTNANIVLLQAILREPDHLRRLAEQSDALHAIQDAQKQLDAHGEEMRQTLAEVRDQHAALAAAKADLSMREEKLKSDTEALARTIATMNDEKMRFEAVRRQVEEQHRAREELIGNREQDANLRVLQLEQWHDAMVRREAVIGPAEERLQKAAEHAKNLLATLG